MQRIGRIIMEYYRETILSGLERLFLFYVVVIVFLANEVVNSKENDGTLISGKACLMRPGKFPNQYEEAVIGIGWVSRKCAPGSEFNYHDCRCSDPTLKNSSEPHNQSPPSPKNSFKSTFEQHSTHSTPSSLISRIITNNDKSQIIVDFTSSHPSNADKLTELLTSPDLTSTTPTTPVIDSTLRDVNETMDLSSAYFRQEVSKTAKAVEPFDGIQADSLTSKIKDFDAKNIITDDMKLSLSDLADLVSSMDQKSNTDSKEKNINTSKSQKLFTIMKPSWATTSQTPEQSGPWKELELTKSKKTSTTNLMLKVLKKDKKERNYKDSKWRRTMATPQQHPKIVLDYSSVTISEPFGVFDLSKDIPSYLPAERWLKSRLLVIETERRRRRNITSNSWFSRNDSLWPQNLLGRQFITSTQRKIKLRAQAAKTVTDNKNKETRTHFLRILGH